MKTTMEDQYR